MTSKIMNANIQLKPYQYLHLVDRNRPSLLREMKQVKRSSSCSLVDFSFVTSILYVLTVDIVFIVNKFTIGNDKQWALENEINSVIQ